MMEVLDELDTSSYVALGVPAAANGKAAKRARGKGKKRAGEPKTLWNGTGRCIIM